MKIREGITIPFFLIFSIFFAVSLIAAEPTDTGATDDSVIMIAGYITPTPLKVIESVTDGTAHQPTVGGIHMTYSGYRNFTNGDGYFSFPKHHPSHELRIIITTKMGYDLYKHTVSKQELPAEKPPIAVYRVQKLRESAQMMNRSEQTDSPSYRTNAPKSVDENQWLWKVKFDGSTPPSGGITSHDLVIFADPKHFYLQDGSVHYAEESNQFVLPHNMLYLLSAPPAPQIRRLDAYTESVDTQRESDVTGGSDGDNAAPPTERAISQASDV